jgi:hypothetical protein
MFSKIVLNILWLYILDVIIWDSIWSFGKYVWCPTFCSIIYVFTFCVLCCDVRYDFHIKAVFGSSLSPVVCRSVDVLFVIFVCVYIVVSIRIDYMSNMKGIRDRNCLHFTNTWVHPGYGWFRVAHVFNCLCYVVLCFLFCLVCLRFVLNVAPLVFSNVYFK